LDEELIEGILETEIYKRMKRERVPFVVIFYASWCPESQKLIEMVSEAAFKYQGKIKFLKVEVEGEERGKIASPIIYNEGKVKDYPTIAFFQNGVMLRILNVKKDREFQFGDLDDVIQKTPFYFSG